MMNMRRIMYVLMTLIMSLVLICSCTNSGYEDIEVAGNEKESSAEDTTIQTQEITTDEYETETETETEIETTSKPLPPNYIYDELGDDADKIVTVGDISIENDELKDLEELLKQCNFNISVKAVSIDGSKCISYNSQKEYFAASTIKAPYLLYCYQQVDAGNGSFDEEMAYKAAYYREGTGDIKDSAEGTVYTMHELMRRTIWNSDNSAYYMCNLKWGKDGYNQMVEQLGIEKLKQPNHSIWVHDVRVDDFVMVWKSIYDYFQTETEGAKAFYDSTTNCKWNFFGQGIKKCTIAQKYGWADKSFSDAGIIYGENETYILAIFTDAEGNATDKKLYGAVAAEVHRLMDRVD